MKETNLWFIRTNSYFVNVRETASRVNRGSAVSNDVMIKHLLFNKFIFLHLLKSLSFENYISWAYDVRIII